MRATYIAVGLPWAGMNPAGELRARMRDLADRLGIATAADMAEDETFVEAQRLADVLDDMVAVAEAHRHQRGGMLL